MDNILNDFIFASRRLLSPFSLSKWLVKNRKVGFSVALFAVLPILGCILTLLLTNQFNIAIWVGFFLVSLLICALVSWLVSATSDRILGKYLNFEYVFCAFSSMHFVSVPLLLIGMFFGTLGMGLLMSSGAADLAPFFTALASLAIVPSGPASLTLLTLIFSAFGIEKNRLIRAFIIYTVIIVAALAILTLFIGQSIIRNITSFLYPAYW